MGKMTPNVQPLFRKVAIFLGVGWGASLVALPSFAQAPGYLWSSGDYANPVGVTVTSSSDSGVQASGTVGTLTNSGTIGSTRTGSIILWRNGSGINNGGAVGAIINNAGGTIRSDQFDGIANNNGSTIASISNAGVIQGGAVGSVYGIYNDSGTSGGTIGSITNTGTIVTGEAGHGYGILNGGTIHTLNNAQGAGNPNGALTYAGNLPANYNIIVNSLSNYGQLNGYVLSGSTTFGIYPGSTLAKGTYASVLTGFTPGVNVNATSGVYNGAAWNLVLNSGTTWDLVVQSSATNTLRSVELNSAGLASIYSRQVLAYHTALSHDCQLYDKYNMCASVGGRYTYDGASPSDSVRAGVVVVGYRPAPTFRFGVFADQSAHSAHSAPSGAPSGFSLRANGPLWGLFARWNMNADGKGLGVQASVASSSSELSVTRSALENTEAGSGRTRLSGQGYQLRVSYQHPLSASTDLGAYLGLRYTRFNTDAYTENTTAAVTSPLSYAAMVRNQLALVGGFGLSRAFAEKYTWSGLLGFQHSLKYSMSDYQGSSNIAGLERFDVQLPSAKRTTLMAATGLGYALSSRERLAINVVWEEQSVAGKGAMSALATYTLGF